MILLDTDVLVDCLRGVSVAQRWLASAAKESFGIPGVVAMELLMGCRHQADVERLQKFLGTFRVLWPDASEFARAYDLLAALRLSTGLSIPDCLIAAMASRARSAFFRPGSVSSSSAKIAATGCCPRNP